MIDSRYVAAFAAAGGYVQEEAIQFVEFCVDLDSQDDRYKSPATTGDSLYTPRIDPALWAVAYDSRAEVAKDYIDYKSGRVPPAAQAGTASRDDDLRSWKRLFDEITEKAAKDRIIIRNAADVERNPNLNGFGPWGNAWVLYRGVGPYSGRYAIAIRGTVFSNAPSAVEDAVFQPLSGRRFLSDAVSFTQDDQATLHGGFGHATFTLLLDRRYGILQHIQEEQKVPSGATLYIVGHSQGAAMATLVHAFLFTSQYQAETTNADPFGLKNRRLRLKSYAVAQPKPGNYAFQSEFSGYTQGPDTAIVINNDIDPVPQVPLTLQTVSDLETDFPGRSLVSRFLTGLGATGKLLRSSASSVLDYFTRKSAEGYGNFYHWEVIRPLGKDRRGSSWNFVSAGRVILVYGAPIANPSSDTFYQHHATTYRDLISSQLPPLTARSGP